jgi:hypothetical protein
MDKLIKEKVREFKKLEKLKPGKKTNDTLASTIEDIEMGSGLHAKRGYLAGYLRAVAEMEDVTLREMLDDL